MAVGLPLLILAMALSTYLGLMTTRGLQWLESVLGILIMLTLMNIAVLATQSGSAFNAAKSGIERVEKKIH